MEHLSLLKKPRLLLKMKKPKPLFIWGSDFHIHNWKQFNPKGERLKLDLDLLRFFSLLAKELGVPFLFSGDLFDNEKALSNKVITKTLIAYKNTFEKLKVLFIGISGNHDQDEANTLDQPSTSYLQGFNAAYETFLLIDNTWVESQGCLVMGIPYLSHNIGLKKQLKAFRKVKTDKRKILLIHTDLHGAKDTSGREVGTTENIGRDFKRMFKGFDLVLSGHIHLPQIIEPGLVYMCGSPKHQNRGDMGSKMGYWIIYDDLSLEFKPITDYPKFKEYYEGEELPDTKNYYTPVARAKAKEDVSSSTRFHTKTPRAKIVKRWAKEVGVKSKSRIKLLTRILNKVE